MNDGGRRSSATSSRPANGPGTRATFSPSSPPPPLLLVAEQGEAWGWGSPRALACYAVGVLGVLAWVREGRSMGDEALIPMRLFRNEVFRRTSLLSVIVGMVMSGGI